MIVLETSAASTEIETTGAATDITDGTAAGSDANVSGGTSTAASGAGITTGGAGAGSTAPGESAVETGAVETTPAETLESIPETTVEETTVPESTEAAKKVKLSFHVVDEDGEDIDEKYADVKVSFDKEGVLTLDDSEKAPVRNIRKLTGTRLFGLLRTYSKNYTYKEATLDGDIIRAIRKTTDEDEHTVYEYTMDGENWTAFEEDSEILLVYCAPETKGSGHAEYIEEGKIKVVVDLKKDLPEGVELRVQEVTDEDQNYDAYMTALDDAAKASASEIEKHSNENTLLYDIAFIGHDEDGQEYEYQPGEDVSVKISFLGGQLAGELGASDADNVVIKHLPVKDEVKENAAKEGQRTTADMTDLSADDIKVEDVKKAKVTLDTEAKIATVDEEEDEDEEKEVAESKDEVTFKTDSFSLWSFSAVASVAAGNSYSEKEIKDALGITTKYGVFAKTFHHWTDMEATIAVQYTDALSHYYGFSDRNYDLINNKITVKKVFKDKNGEPLANKAVTIQLYLNGALYRSQDVTTGTDGSALTTFEKVPDGDYSLGEVYNGQMFTPAEKEHTFPDDTTVRASFSDPDSIVTNYSNVNYIGEIEDNLWEEAVGKSRGGVIIVGNDKDYNGMKQYASKYNATVRRADETTDIDFNAVFNQMAALSRKLVNAVDSDTVKVFNLTAKSAENNDTNWVTIDENHSESRYVVLNIDCTNDERWDHSHGVSLGGRFKIDGVPLKDEFTDDGKKILYNFYTRDGENIEPYTGEITLQAGNAGVMLAPCATVGNLSGSFAGTIVAATCDHKGSEVHGSNFNSAKSVHLEMNIVNEYTETTSVSGKKTWADNNNRDGKRPASITVKLYANSKEVPGSSKTVTAKDNWEYSWNNLDKYKDGNPITYTVEEVGTISDYTPSYDSNHINVTNTYTPEKTSVSGTKTWADNNNQDGKRPASITVKLYANSKEVSGSSKTVTAKDNWEYSWNDLDMYKDGHLIKYTVVEEPVEYYTPSYDTAHVNVTNTYAPKKTSVSGTKTWADNNNQDGKRPSEITVDLYADGVKVDGQSKTVTEADGWTYSWNNLDKYKNGKEIKYTVEEATTVDGYTPSYDDAHINVTNTHTPVTTSVLVKKNWDDSNDASGKRPSEIKVNLLADGNKIQDATVTADASGDWSYEFTDLPMYKEGMVGQKINYTVTEEEIPGYVLDSKSSTEDGKTVVQLTNKSIDFKVNKFERTGTRELDGAKIQIKDSTGAVIAEWISKSGETHDFGSKLKAGETYTIHEETAPSGYYTISDMNFTVGEKGEITLAGSSDDVKLEDGVIKICDERIKSSGGGGGGDHPHPTPETTPAETTPAETTVPETTPVETTAPETNPGGGNGGHHGPSEEVETDEFGNVLGANRGRNKKGQDGGNVKGANRGKTRTGDESMMSIFGFGFLAAVLVLLGWFGIRFTKRNRR